MSKILVYIPPRSFTSLELYHSKIFRSNARSKRLESDLETVFSPSWIIKYAKIKGARELTNWPRFREYLLKYCAMPWKWYQEWHSWISQNVCVFPPVKCLPDVHTIKHTYTATQTVRLTQIQTESHGLKNSQPNRQSQIYKQPHKNRRHPMDTPLKQTISHLSWWRWRWNWKLKNLTL